MPSASETDLGAPDLGAADAGDTRDDLGPADLDPIDLGAPDLGPADLGAPDLGFDGGIDLGPSRCPDDPNAECQNAEACGANIPAPTNCEVCVPSNHSLCANATCETPPTLAATELYAIVVQISPAVPVIQSFGGFLIAERTAGEQVLTCADVYAGQVALPDPCVNVLDSRTLSLNQGGDTFTISFGGFASSQRTLFVVYGYTGTQTRGTRVGVSCTEVDVGPPTGGDPTFIGGQTMVPL